jgi:hypothetical protein
MKKSILYKTKYENLIDGLELNDTQKSVLKSTWLDYLLLVNGSANKGWFRHNYSQIIVIALSLLIPIIEKTKINSDIFELNLSVVSILGLIVAGLTTLNRQLGFEEKWRHFRRAAETIRNEGDDFFALSGHYEKYNSHAEAFKFFAKSLTEFKRKEATVYIEEEQKMKKSLKKENGD